MDLLQRRSVNLPEDRLDNRHYAKTAGHHAIVKVRNIRQTAHDRCWQRQWTVVETQEAHSLCQQKAIA